MSSGQTPIIMANQLVNYTVPLALERSKIISGIWIGEIYKNFVSNPSHDVTMGFHRSVERFPHVRIFWNGNRPRSASSSRVLAAICHDQTVDIDPSSIRLFPFNFHNSFSTLIPRRLSFNRITFLPPVRYRYCFNINLFSRVVQ